MDRFESKRSVFISYSSKDRVCAEVILKGLERRGISCWFAPRDVPGGANYMGTISRAIQTAHVAVVILSRNANGSDHMKKEVVLAGRRRIPIIGMRIDTAALDDDWTFEFSARQFFDASVGLDPVIRSLADQIQSTIIGGAEQRSEPPAAAAVRSVPYSLALQPAPKRLLPLLRSHFASLIVMFGALVTFVAIGAVYLAFPKPVVSHAQISPPVLPQASPPQTKCGYLPVYPRPPGPC